jgi:hypothetical protein
MTVHQDIQGHLNAAERNPAKRAQHLLSATQHAEANGVPHFGRWSEQQIRRREAEFKEREKLKEFQDRVTNRKGPAPAAIAPTAEVAQRKPPALALLR